MTTPRRSPGQSASRARAVALGTTSALALVAASELALRLLGFGGRAPLSLVHDARSLPGVAQFLPAQRDGREGLIRIDDDCGYALAAPYRSSAEHAGTYALGDWPWRGRPAVEAPTASGAPFPTVLVVGDSNPYGIGVETADTLPERLAVELEARGHPRAGLQVLNLGVPGYSTVQVERLLERELARHRPQAVVFYVAAWNDQAPASSFPDEELLARRARRSFVDESALADALGSLRRPPSGPAVDAHAEAMQWLASGSAPRGPRVPEDEIEERVRRMLAAVEASGALPLAIAPAHPSATEAAHPRVVRDRAAVQRAARGAEALFVDAEAVAAATTRADTELFVDWVHPSPIFWHAVASAVADELAPRLTSAVADAGGLVVRGLEPRRAPTLGDVRLELWIDGLGAGDAPPVVTVGGAPLLDLERTGDDRLVGTLVTNSAGALDLLVQRGPHVVVERGAVELVPPSIERTPGGAVVVAARPHDRALVFQATRAARPPMHSPVGVSLLDIGALVGAPLEIDLGPQGRAELTAPIAPGAFVQALIVPRGEAVGIQEARLTGMLAPL